MVSKHSVITLQANSCYLSRICPVKRAKFRPGDQVVLCHEKDEVVSWDAWPQWEGRCLYCGHVVSEWGWISSPEQESYPKKEKPFQPTREPQPAPIMLPWRTIGLALVLLICGVPLLAFGVLRSISKDEPTQTPYPTIIASATATPTLGTEPSGGLPTSVATTTDVPKPMATDTPKPTATDTPKPTATNTPKPPTSTPSPFDPVLIPAGNFTRGSTSADVQFVMNQICSYYTDSWCRENSFTDELTSDEVRDPQAGVYYIDNRKVYLDDFYIDRYEVTNAEYALCVQARSCTPPQGIGSNPRHAYFTDPHYADHPVIYVTWDNAQAYCAWIGARLPTADEWEKAARGDDGRLWPWGNNIPTTEANFRPPGQSAADEANVTRVGGDPAPVGSFSSDRSPYGVMDMAGNVMEWVNAQYGPGKLDIRGGSWNTGSFALRAASRTGRPPSALYFDVGFRCVRDARP